MMKKLLLLIATLLFSTSLFASVVPQGAYNNNGQPIVRFYNNTYNPVSCYIRDQYNYYTFIIYPKTYSLWYVVYGPYKWQCR